MSSEPSASWIPADTEKQNLPFHDGLAGPHPRKRYREKRQILSATEEDIQKLAPYMEAILKTGSICALGGEERMKKERAVQELKP